MPMELAKACTAALRIATLIVAKLSAPKLRSSENSQNTTNSTSDSRPAAQPNTKLVQ